MMAMVWVRVVITGILLLFTRFIPKLPRDDCFLQHGTYQGTENRGGSFPLQSRFTRGSALHPVGTIFMVIMGSQAFVSLRVAASKPCWGAGKLRVCIYRTTQCGACNGARMKLGCGQILACKDFDGKGADIP